MADATQLKALKKGAKAWAAWRLKYPKIRIDLSGADLREANLCNLNLYMANLCEADLSGANLNGAILTWADLSDANLTDATLYRATLPGAILDGAHLCNTYLAGANMEGASFCKADLTKANLTEASLMYAELSYAILTRASICGADLSEAILCHAVLSGSSLHRANLSEADLASANLRWADLEQAILVKTNLSDAVLEECSVFGVSAWELTLNGANQKNLKITQAFEPDVTVDDLEVAQFIYLMLNNKKVRNIINTISSKAVLILGRFTKQRKAILEVIRKELRQRGYLPILFDFEKPTTRDLTETISTLAHMARFIIADLTDAKSIPQELQAIVPHLPSVPVKPVLMASEEEYGMFEHFQRYPQVLDTYIYESRKKLIANLKEKVIAQAEAKAEELTR